LVGELGPGLAVEYLHDYLHVLGARSFAVERHYIDRHFLEEYTQYYARSFVPPVQHCERLHFFSSSREELETLLGSCIAVDRHEAQQALQAQYLGFVVKRPLTSAPIGRSVLAPYPEHDTRHYEAVRPYRVHLLTFDLRIKGLAYQQQDRGAAVCASTALWSALQRVAYVSGNRTPTPAAVTRAANSPFPASSGLDLRQMATALATLGYSADHFAPQDNRALFRAKVVACLRSALPVVLLIRRKVKSTAGEVTLGHAVTATGYKGPLAITDVPLLREGVDPLQMRGGGLSVTYVHDDNLGSHAHYEFLDGTDLDEDKNHVLLLRRGQQETRRWKCSLTPGAAGFVSPHSNTATVARAEQVVTVKRTSYVRSLRLRILGKPKPGATVEAVLWFSDDFGANWGASKYAVVAQSDGREAELLLPPVLLHDGNQLSVRLESKSHADLVVECAFDLAPTVNGWEVDEWAVLGALVPKPDKVRLPVEELILSPVLVRRLLGEKVFPGVPLHFDCRFSTGIDYRAEVVRLSLAPAGLMTFVRGTPLPRHVGVVSVWTADTHLCDLVLDVTEVGRDRLHPPVIAAIAPGVTPGSKAAVNLEAVAAKLGWTFVAAREVAPA
jgi:hypothetical protein